MSPSFVVFCSGEKEGDCKRIEANRTEELVWKAGTFSVTVQGRKLIYSASVPEPHDDYINKDDGSVSLVLTEELTLLALRRGAEPTKIGSFKQPAGYPVRPNTSIQSGRAGSVVPLVISQRPAADFER